MIRVGMAVYGPNWETFAEILRRAKTWADEIVIVYGNFKGFDVLEGEQEGQASIGQDVLEGVKWITHCGGTQAEHRQLYADGLQPGDILVVLDSDTLPMPGPRCWTRVLAEFQEGKYDSGQIPLFTPDLRQEQTAIMVYRWRHGFHYQDHAGVQDEHGSMIASPFYRVMYMGNYVHLIHRRDQGEQYREHQQRYWKRQSAHRGGRPSPVELS